MTQHTMVVLDDDPTGTQTITDLPILTGWSVDDVRWALRQRTAAIFVLTNTRSLPPDAAGARVREIAEVVCVAAQLEHVDIVFASRSDSTLRGHFPLETEVIADVLREHGISTDAVLVAPAYIDAGRLTIDSTQYVVRDDLLVPVAETEFARDAAFAYTSSDLPGWMHEKSGGRIVSDDVVRVTRKDLLPQGAPALDAKLSTAGEPAYIACDGQTDAELRVLAEAVIAAEARGRRFIYRVGPSFVRARCGQSAAAPLSDLDLVGLTAQGQGLNGLVVVGSHVALTSRQVKTLRDERSPVEIEVAVHRLLDPTGSAEYEHLIAGRVLKALTHSTVVLVTSRRVVESDDEGAGLAASRTISRGLVAIVREVLASQRLGFLVAKGGITSSDLATAALRMTRAWAVGTMLPGMISVWRAAENADIAPLVIFPGNVGDDRALSLVVDRLESATTWRKDRV